METPVLTNAHIFQNGLEENCHQEKFQFYHSWSGGFEKAQEIRAQLEKMKAEGAWKKYFSDKKSNALPPEVPGAPPGERLAWHRAIPTEVDPWSRPFSFWDCPWKRVCADSLSGRAPLSSSLISIPLWAALISMEAPCHHWS